MRGIFSDEILLQACAPRSSSYRHGRGGLGQRLEVSAGSAEKFIEKKGGVGCISGTFWSHGTLFFIKVVSPHSSSEAAAQVKWRRTPGRKGSGRETGADIQDLTQDELLGHGNHVYGARPREEGWL